MTIMTTHVSATAPETPHETEITQIAISDALRRRAQAVINDSSIDPQWRVIVRYALEINDPSLADLVRRADAGERIIDTIDLAETGKPTKPIQVKKIEALAEIICRTGDESTAALFVLMGTLENSSHPKLLANNAKHLAFTHCCQSNLYGIVDAQIEVVEGELLST